MFSFHNPFYQWHIYNLFFWGEGGKKFIIPIIYFIVYYKYFSNISTILCIILNNSLGFLASWGAIYCEGVEG